MLQGRGLGSGRALFVGRASLETPSIQWRACGLFDEACQWGFWAEGGRNGRLGCVPVNVRPKTSCSGGTSSFGVVVLMMERASELMLGSLASSSSCDCILYGLLHCQLGPGSRHGAALKAGRQDLAQKSDGWPAISAQ